jgi:enoyl-CoA hydratase/carnithine racemase
MSDRVRVSHDDHLAIVSLYHLARLNVLDQQGWEALANTMTALGEDPNVRCVMIEGSGDRAFSAGSDIGKFPAERQSPEQIEAYGQALESALGAVHGCPHPTLALIHGVCVGGGLEIAAACDLRICSESSRFGAPINRLGLTMSYTELAPLVELAGASGALEILLEGGLLDAQRAYQKGLVNRVVPDDEVEEEAWATARRIVAGAPLVNRWHKKFVRRLTDGGGPLTEDERKEAYEAFKTDDYLEGVLAFLERRDPRFEGK